MTVKLSELPADLEISSGDLVFITDETGVSKTLSGQVFLDTFTEEAPVDTQQYVRKDGTWIVRKSDLLTEGAIDYAPATLEAAKSVNGFDREAPDISVTNKNLGILQYCNSAASGEIHQIASDVNGTYTLLTGQTVFADGTPLADRTIMQYHDAGETEYSYWNKGVNVVVTGSKSYQLPVGFKGYIYYDDNGDLTAGVTDERELIVRTCLVSYIYLNSTNAEITWFADERHGIVMDGQTHLQQHDSRGFFIESGVDPVGIVNNGTTFTSISAGNGYDEDIQSVLSSYATIPKLYKEGSLNEWRVTDDDNKLGIFRAGLCCYNDLSAAATLTAIGADYVVMMIVACNNKLHPVVMLVGQTLHLTRGDARNNMPAEYFRLTKDGLPSHELLPVASMILHVEATGQIEIGADGEIYTVTKYGFPMGVFS